MRFPEDPNVHSHEAMIAAHNLIDYDVNLREWVRVEIIVLEWDSSFFHTVRPSFKSHNLQIDEGGTPGWLLKGGLRKRLDNACMAAAQKWWDANVKGKTCVKLTGLADAHAKVTGWKTIEIPVIGNDMGLLHCPNGYHAEICDEGGNWKRYRFKDSYKPHMYTHLSDDLLTFIEGGGRKTSHITPDLACYW